MVANEHIIIHIESKNHIIKKRIIIQILTNLLALGVLEFESGFENAINKTFKVLRKIYISFF